ncbi:uncharacterized protein BcabD6B2_07530 [Babesia caballi]|uniref:Uncharacterized protein n=1 Tax=Babesia caballi TaxID=5871 RepID=A0AAV4LMC3_BABCB|nr:hypothetical protein, conserved [Babesia caballi]
MATVVRPGPGMETEAAELTSELGEERGLEELGAAVLLDGELAQVVDGAGHAAAALEGEDGAPLADQLLGEDVLGGAGDQEGPRGEVRGELVCAEGGDAVHDGAVEGGLRDGTDDDDFAAGVVDDARMHGRLANGGVLGVDEGALYCSGWTHGNGVLAELGLELGVGGHVVVAGLHASLVAELAGVAVAGAREDHVLLVSAVDVVRGLVRALSEGPLQPWGHISDNSNERTPASKVNGCNLLREGGAEVHAVDVGALLADHAAVVESGVAHLLAGDFGVGLGPGLVADGAEAVVVELEAPGSRAGGSARGVDEAQGAEGDAVASSGVGALDDHVVLVRQAVDGGLLDDAAGDVGFGAHALQAVRRVRGCGTMRPA